jgi:membrane protease YdiL (CAAX protease family)
MFAGWVIVRRSARSWRQLGWPHASLGGRAFVAGAGVGLLMAGGAIGISVVSGATVRLTGEAPSAYLMHAWTVSAGLGVAALAEELVFRGFPLVSLAEVLGRGRAAVVFAVLFAAAHAVNPQVSLLGLVNIALAALVMSAVFFGRGGLPAAWGVHLGWNAGLGVGVDAPVSGLGLDLPAVEYRAGGPEWITGGLFGPEGGVAATVMFGVALVWFVRKIDKREEGSAAT